MKFKIVLNYKVMLNNKTVKLDFVKEPLPTQNQPLFIFDLSGMNPQTNQI